MKIIAYSYTNPLLETAPDPTTWGWEVDQIYQDLGDRQQLRQLLQDCQTQAVDYLLIRQLEELGDSVEEVCYGLTQLESLNIQIIPLKSDIQINQHQPNNTQATKTDLLKLLDQIRQNQHSRKIRASHARNRIKALMR